MTAPPDRRVADDAARRWQPLLASLLGLLLAVVLGHAAGVAEDWLRADLAPLQAPGRASASSGSGFAVRASHPDAPVPATRLRAPWERDARRQPAAEVLRLKAEN